MTDEDEDAPAEEQGRDGGREEQRCDGPIYSYKPEIKWLVVVGNHESWHDREPCHRHCLKIVRFPNIEWTATRRRRDVNIQPPGKGWQFYSETDHDSSLWFRVIEPSSETGTDRAKRQ